ncbi:conserved hypothetical protein [Ricinus communis]|uniref:Uncharacterized protein n=1 Tax=Ricinus communis TaxID=3988 RepID=B9T8Q7_RICCO|nr:conserved hypothetical protein [Ricinus communis]
MSDRYEYRVAGAGRPSRERVARGGRHAPDAAGRVAATAHAGGNRRHGPHAQGWPQHPADGGWRGDGRILRAHPAAVGTGHRRTGGAAGRHLRHAAHRRGDHGGAPAAATAGAVHAQAAGRAAQAPGGQPHGDHQHAGAARDRAGHHGHAAARTAHQRGPLRAPPDGVCRQPVTPADEEEKDHAQRRDGSQPAGARARLGHAHGGGKAAARGRARGGIWLRGVEQRGDQAHGVRRAGRGLFVGARLRAGI